MPQQRAPFVFRTAIAVVVAVVAVVVVVAAGVACTPSSSSSSDAADDRCSFTRIGSDDAVAYSLVDDDAIATAKPVDKPCGNATCLHVDPIIASIVGPDGSTWILEAGKEPRVVAAAPPEPALATAASPTKLHPGSNVPEPSVPFGYRTCGTVSVGGGFGFHVIKNDGSVWSRIEWVVPPTDPAVKALPPSAYPLPTPGPTRALCAWAEQTSPRNWVVHHVASGKTITAAKDMEHPPAHCHADGGVEVARGDGDFVLVGVDGKETATQTGPAAPPRTEVELDGSSVINAPKDRLFVVRKDRTRAELPAALFAAGVVERVSTVGDGDHRLLVAVRARLPGCATKETLWLLDATTIAASPVKSGDVVFTRLSYGLGRFWWIESQPKLVDTNG